MTQEKVILLTLCTNKQMDGSCEMLYGLRARLDDILVKLASLSTKVLLLDMRHTRIEHYDKKNTPGFP